MRCNLFHKNGWILPLAFVSYVLASKNQTLDDVNVPDSALSASERNRRLIPYMAFYLPAPELPINQQYAKQQGKSHQPAAGGAAQLQAPAAGRIPVPVAYMPQSHSHSHPAGHHIQQQHYHHHVPPPSHYQSNAGEVYHALAIGNNNHHHAHHLQSQHQHQQQSQPQHQQQHLATAVPPPVAAKGSPKLPADAFIAYKPLHSTHKHKTVQHFPPLMPQQTQVQQQQPLPQQPEQFELLSPPLPPSTQYQRQRAKQSKINLTPFTAQNTLPGHFIPIIYTPVSNSHEPHNSNTINYNGNNNNNNNIKQSTTATETEIVYEPAHHQQQQQQQQQHKNSHQTQSVTNYAEESPAAGEEQPPIPSHVSYHVYNEHGGQPSSPSTSSAAAATAASPSSSQSAHTSAKYESYFNMALPSDQQLTPQQKYVLYLQQRLKHHQKSYLHQQQPPSAASTSSLSASGQLLHAGKNPHSHSSSSHQHSHSHLHSQHSQKYEPASTLYARPVEAAALPQLQQQQQQLQQHQSHQSQQQVLHIPLRAIIGQQQQQSTRHEFVKEAALGSPAPPHYADYLIDGPRQSLDEEQQNTHESPPRPSAPPRLLRPTLAPPQTAFILVTTAAPHELHEQLQTTPRPPLVAPHFKQQPTLRLQPVTPPHNYKATRRPIYVTTETPVQVSQSSQTVEITPKYVYVKQPPLPAAPPPLPPAVPTATPVKLKPSYKYEHVTVSQPAANQADFAADSDDDQLPDIRTSSLAEILHKLQASNHLPQTLTPDNIDNSIKTLIRILHNLKQQQHIVPNPSQHHEPPPKGSSNDYNDYNAEPQEEPQAHTPTGTDTGTGIGTTSSEQDVELSALVPLSGPNKHPGPSTGRPGIDYPNYAEIPQTNFDCSQQRYKGFFGDPETNCQVWHYCDLNGGKASFLCPNGTIFSQIALTCDWWFNVKCSTTAQLYVLNERLYKYILPFNPKFPEDYNGPIVDKYLALKFQEMEEKMRLEKQRKANAPSQTEKSETSDQATPALPKNHKPYSSKHGSAINAQVYEQSSERNLLIDDEIDDISERGTYDTYGQEEPTTIMAPASTTQELESLSLKPIVVSSTPEPELDQEVEPVVESDEATDKLQALRDTKAAQKPLRETTKVSVEKLEVIEIKTDGNTGQLMPVVDLNRSEESSEQAEK